MFTFANSGEENSVWRSRIQLCDSFADTEKKFLALISARTNLFHSTDFFKFV